MALREPKGTDCRWSRTDCRWSRTDCRWKGDGLSVK